MTDVDPLKVDAAGGQVTDAQAALIERTVIAAVLADRGALSWIGDELVAADFADPRLGRIFDGFYEMLRDREPVTPITVADHLAGWGVRGISLGDLHSWAAEALPHETGWFARKVHDLAIRRELLAEAVRLAQKARGTDPAGEILAGAIDHLRELQTRGVREEVTARTLGAVLEQDTSYDWAVEGLIERGDRLILTGSEGGGKTTMLRQIAVMAAAGLHPFSGGEFEPVQVLYVDTENTEKQWARETAGLAKNAAHYGRTDPRDTLRLHVTKRMNLTSDRDLGMLHRLVDLYNPAVLVIGPLYRLVPFAINDDDEATPLLTALDTIRDRGVALCIEAHAGHGRNGQNERDLRPRGSSALMGWPEFGLGLRVDKGAKSSDVFELSQWRGHRDAGRMWPLRVQRRAGVWPWMTA
jgi:replicative DNA helicase